VRVSRHFAITEKVKLEFITDESVDAVAVTVHV
jgi:hypothetical protein